MPTEREPVPIVLTVSNDPAVVPEVIVADKRAPAFMVTAAATVDTVFKK